jgi:hypothetical protein
MMKLVIAFRVIDRGIVALFSKDLGRQLLAGIAVDAGGIDKDISVEVRG